MPKVAPIQTSFATGEVSPLLYGRVDLPRYKEGLAVGLNAILPLQGPWMNRPGTKYVSAVKTAGKKTRLVSFEFSTTQAYILEFGDLYIRFYKDNGRIESGGSPVEVVTTYAEADLFQLKFTQSADTLYITHPSYAPKKLTRSSHTSWTLTALAFSGVGGLGTGSNGLPADGPYLPVNTTSAGASSTATITPSATTGFGITLTASSALFASTDVGRLVRVKDPNGGVPNIWVTLIITAYSSSTLVTVNRIGAVAFGTTSAKPNWRLGAWSGTTGYPASSVFHEDRLFFSGPSSFPQRLDGSATGDYENFSPTSDTIDITTDDTAVSFTLSSNQVNAMRWLESQEKGLIAGSTGSPWLVRPSDQGEAITPTNINAKRVSAPPSADIQPIQVGNAILYVHRSSRKLRELTYFYESDGFKAPDLTQLSEHVTETGIVEMAFQEEPFPIVWLVRNDGLLASMTYERDSDGLRAGWARHQIAGTSDAAGTNAVVESVACIPASDGSHSELWMVVKRYVNGATVRYVEYMTPFFDAETEQKDAFFVDAGLTYDAPITVSGATAANPVVITATAHGFSNGDYVLISDVSGMTELNGNTYLVANKTANTFELSGVNGTAYTAYISGGEVRKYVTTISGLSHLEGQSVTILGDGAVQPNKTVSAGAITLATRATTVQIGLGYHSDGQLLRIDAGAADGTALGKIRRTHRVGFLLHRSLGLKIGTSFDELTEVVFRTGDDLYSRATPLYSGIVSETLEADYDFENQLCWRQEYPLPLMVLAVMPRMETQDG